MNLHQLATPAVLLAGLATLAIGLTTASPTIPTEARTAKNSRPVLVEAHRALGPVVAGTTWTNDPFTMNRLGERHGATLPFPPPPPVTLPPLPTMPFRQVPATSP